MTPELEREITGLVRQARRVLDLVTFYLVLPVTAAVLGTLGFVIYLVATYV